MTGMRHWFRWWAVLAMLGAPAWRAVPARADNQVEVVPGDVDGDGLVTVADAQLALRVALGIVPQAGLTAQQQEAGDVSPVPGVGPRSGRGWGDGRITLEDAVSIARHVSGLGPDPWPGYTYPATFTFLQRAIFSQSCATPTCHGGAAPKAGMELDDANAYANLVGVASSEVPGKLRVDPFHPEKSYLLDKLTGASGIDGVRMPYGADGLPPNAVDVVQRWIAEGAPNNGQPIVDLPGSIAASSQPEQDVSLPPPAPGQGFQVAIGPFNVPPGSEIQRNYYQHLPNDTDVDVVEIQMALNPGSHHCTLFKRDDVNLPDHYEDSFDQIAWDSWDLVVNSQIPNLDWRLPPGVGIHFRAHQQMDFQLHYVNIPSQLLVTPTNRGKAVINFYTAAPGQVKWHVGTLFARNTSIVIPPRQTVSFTKVCPIPQDVHIIAMNGHFHSRGRQFLVDLWDPVTGTGPEVYRSDNFDDPKFVIYSNPIALKAGQGISYTATYQNNTDRTFTFGPLEETEEHCNLFLYYYPALPGDKGLNYF